MNRIFSERSPRGDRPHLYMLVDGEPRSTEDVIEWGRWYETSADARRVAATTLIADDSGNARVWVSTVFLGLDQNNFVDGPAILWETMVFGVPLYEEHRRYASRDEAETGHAEVVGECRRLLRNMGGRPAESAER